MLKVYTSTINYDGNDKLDIASATEDSLGKMLAPTWNLVSGYKLGKINQKEYERVYHSILNISRNNNPKTWEYMLSLDRLVLCCHCTPKEFCHRYIASRYLVDLGAECCGEI